MRDILTVIRTANPLWKLALIVLVTQIITLIAMLIVGMPWAYGVVAVNVVVMGYIATAGVLDRVTGRSER